MIILTIKKIIGLTLLILGLGLLLLPFHSTRADWNDPAVQYGYVTTRTDPAVFAPTNGNQRLELKNLADIERASAPTIHRDVQVNADYMCNWIYDKVLGRYVCEKDYMKAYAYTHPRPVPVCPFGYKLNYGGSDCVRILFPSNAHLNARGDGWECNPGYHTNLTGTVCIKPEYVYQQCPGGSFNCNSGCNTGTFVRPILTAQPIYVQQIVQIFKGPNRLPATGPSFLGLLLGLSALVTKKLLKR